MKISSPKCIGGFLSMGTAVAGRVKHLALSVFAAALLALFAASTLSADPISLTDPLTFTVTMIVNQPGMAKVSLLIGGVFVDVIVTVAANDTPADVAAKIAGAVPGARANGATVTFPNRVDGVLFITAPVNRSIRGTAAVVGFNMAPGQPAGELAFLPDPATGGTSLLASATITAGFGSGLPDVSFTAGAGTSLASLTSTLNTDLDNDGYVTSLLNTTDILVYDNGATAPTDLFLTLDPVSGDSPDVGAEVTMIPEPDFTMICLIAGAAFAGVRARRGK